MLNSFFRIITAIISHLFRYLYMTIIIGIILSLLALSMVYERKGRWYNYLAVVVLSAIVTIALMLVGSNP